MFLKRLFGFTCLFTLALLFAPLGGRAETHNTAAAITVTTTADSLAGDGECSLREAVLAANLDLAQDACPAGSGDDTIVLPAGVYPLALPGRVENAALTGDLDVTASLTLTGAGRDFTVIDGGQLDRLFHVLSPATLRISDLTVRNGNPGTLLADPDHYGGGFLVGPGATAHLRRVVVRDSQAFQGGGLMNNGGWVTLNETAVWDNSAAYVGGLYNTGQLVINDSAVSGNQATYYGGGVLSNASLEMQASEISANVSGTNGGGLYIHSGTATLLNSTISANQTNGYVGGGVWVYYQAEITVTNTTIAANIGGGGLFNYHEEALQAGGPAAADVLQLGNIRLQNSLLADNLPVNCGRSASSPVIDSLGHNLESANTCELGGLGDQVNTAPLLGALQDNGGPTRTHALLSGSPAQNAGDNLACPSTDQRGVTRPSGAACDTGAFEVVEGLAADLGLVLSAAPDPVQAGGTLTYTLAVDNAGPDPADLLTARVSLPPGAAYQGFTGSGWDCLLDSGGDALACKRNKLTPGPAPALFILLQAPEVGGVLTGSASVFSVLPDPQPDDNTAGVQTVVASTAQASTFLPLIRRGP